MNNTHQSMTASSRFVNVSSNVMFGVGVHDSACRIVRIMILIFGVSLVASPWNAPTFGQGKTAKKKVETLLKGAKAAKGGNAEVPAEKPLEEIDFSAAHKTLLENGAVKELDETAEGKKRLDEIFSRAKGIFEQREVVDSERRPYAANRDQLVGEVLILNQRNAQTRAGIQQAENNLRTLRNSANNGGNNQNLQDQIETLQDQITDAYASLTSNQNAIDRRTPEINALNIQITQFDGKLLLLWADLNECRKQWLELRQPHDKYAHGNFEGLQRVLTDWILIDNLWPEAYLWDALCKYELGNYQAAWDQVEKASDLRQTLRFPKAWPQGDAFRGLTAAKLPERRGKAANFLLAAGTSIAREKNSSWFVLFLLGRAACENEKTEAKAKTYFERSLKSRPDSDCVNYWLAQLQCTSSTDTVRDAGAAIKTFEDLWKRSSKQSWRLAYLMVLAYDGAKQDAEAQATWKLVEKLASKPDLEQMQTERTEIQAKLSLPKTDEPKIKPSTGKKKVKSAE